MDEYEAGRALRDALDRLTLLSDVTEALASTLEAAEAVRRVCGILVPRLADWCAVDLMAEDGARREFAAPRDDAAALAFRAADSPAPVPSPPRGPLAAVLSGGGPLLLDSTDLPAPGESGAHQRMTVREREPLTSVGARSVVIVPLRARGVLLGALSVARGQGREPLVAADLPLVVNLAHHMALAVDNGRMHGETQRIAERLQRSLFADLPDVAPLRLAAGYQPSQTTAEVGGDWYDSFVLPKGDIALIIGDVAGHDLQATVAMSQVRNMLRGVACDRQEPPGKILARLDRAVHTLTPSATTTCIYALVKGDRGGPWTLHWSRAGHLPPLLITAAGRTRFLDAAGSLLLGVEPDVVRLSAHRRLDPGTTLLLYTDGLVERRHEPLDRSMTRLRQVAAAFATEPLDALVDKLLGDIGADSDDDIALLALRVP